MISRIEFAAEEIIDSGLQQEWLQGADAAARAVIGSVNGPLLQQLLEATEYDDLSVVEMLLKGAPMVGQLDNCDVGDLQGAMVNQLWQRRHASNEKLLSDLEEQGAVYAEPRLEEPHLQPEYWQVLKERWCSE